MTGASKRDVEVRDVNASSVALRIAGFLVRTELDRLHLFRMHLEATVRKVSPLLLELATLEGVSLSDAVTLIRPPQDWPWRPIHDSQPVLVRRAQRLRHGNGKIGRSEAQHFDRAFAAPGVVIRAVDDPRGRFAIRHFGPVLGFTAEVGGCLLTAFGGSAMLKFPGPLPEIVTSAAAGRSLDQVVDHPVFAGRDYTVLRIMPDSADGLPVLTFRATLVPFVMPYATISERAAA
ncbi:hypothetical protein SAMN05216382_2692 [Sphingomonas palmae]|uniref:Uncharacterized protein n=1 Tax=Sphingomonas palmae TaxID=1855283 RepID=A0A1H7T8D7_9SPHN|nr:hypothetical protein [Sphingomonas palmae]SEL80775.1 hypothetical protein SAMN05216382_2692 [Sphingomonas palmae]